MKNITTREEYEKQNKFFTKKECPFCDKDMGKNNNILYENEKWYIIYNKFPYFDEKDHLLVFPKKHRKLTQDIKKIEYTYLKDIEKFIDNYFDGKEYFSFIRQSCGNRSVEHLHYHYLPGLPASKSIDNTRYIEILNI